MTTRTSTRPIPGPLGQVANQAYAGAEALILAMLCGTVGAALLQPSTPVSEAVTSAEASSPMEGALR